MLIELIFWVAIGLWDLYLISRHIAYKYFNITKSKHKSISQMVEMFMPENIDVAIVVALLAGVWWLCGPAEFVVALRWTVIGHVLLGNETWTQKR